jgi:hypothetical protein
MVDRDTQIENIATLLIAEVRITRDDDEMTVYEMTSPLDGSAIELIETDECYNATILGSHQFVIRVFYFSDACRAIAEALVNAASQPEPITRRIEKLFLGEAANENTSFA